jgi:choline dehydrogenase-like flavoprotein
MYDIIIIGAGAAGVMAASRIRRLRTLILDVGYKPPDTCGMAGNIYELKKNNPKQFEYLIGKNYESIHNIDRDYRNPKLKAPYTSYVVKNAEKLLPVMTRGFSPVVSFAYGGLANAWGANVHRFMDDDLRDFHLQYKDLKPYYDQLTELIGISGAEDELYHYLGESKSLQPPLRLTESARKILKLYTRHRESFHKYGIRMGRPRLAVLTAEHRGRESFRYNGDEFWRTDDPAIYTPRTTLEEILTQEHLEYHGGALVTRFEESEKYVSVFIEDVETHQHREFRARRLILAAGTLNTAKLVLQSFGDTSSRLPLLDNAVSYVPLLDPLAIGKPLDTKGFGLAQLNLTYENAKNATKVIGGFYEYSSGLRSDLFFNFPLSFTANLACCKYLLPALSFIQFLYPSMSSAGNYVQLSSDGHLQIVWENPVERGDVERRLIKIFRRHGYLSHISLCQFPAAGSSIHYAGTLPMTHEARPYTVDLKGRLRPTHAIFIVDASTFPSLPCKNLTFTLMANAMRVSDCVQASLWNAGLGRAMNSTQSA